MTEGVIEVISRITSFCKSRHAYLRAVCEHVLKASDNVNEPDAVLNLLFYPLQIASSVTSEEKLFLPLALEGIVCLLQLRLLTEETIYAPPEVPFSVQKKKGLFNATDITAPRQDSTFKAASVEASNQFVDVVLDTVRPHRHSMLGGVALLVLQCLTDLMSHCKWLSGQRLLDCFQSAFEARLKIGPLTGSGASNSLLSQALTTILTRRANALPVVSAGAVEGDIAGGGENEIRVDVSTVLDDGQCVLGVTGCNLTSKNDVGGLSLPDGMDSHLQEQQQQNTSSLPLVPVLSSSSLLLPHKQEMLLDYDQDCYNILSRICDLSIKSVDSCANGDTLELRSKRLSCRLLALFVNEMDYHFAHSDLLQSALHEKITVSLLHNCTMEDPELYRVALKTLYHLVITYRELFKSKVATFFLGVLLPMLSSKNILYQQKSAILTFFEITMREPQVLIDWFTNFDCIQGMPNLCEKLVSGLSKVAGMSHVSPWVTVKQDGALRLECMKALRTYIRSVESIAKTFSMDNSAFCGTSGGELKPVSKELMESDDVESRKSDEKELEEQNGGNYIRGATGGTQLSDLDVQQLLREKKAFDTVVDMFNAGDYADAIEMAHNVQLLSNMTPEAVACFLMRKELNPVAVGEYLSKDNDERKSILRAFIGMNKFTGLLIDEAMRLFLGKFKLPGEAQVIDRAMGVFAEQYCAQNPTSFSGPGPVFILAFSIMILNTDAHSKHIKEKMTLEQFIQNNRGIDDGKDLPVSLLEGIYHRIRTNAIVLEPRGAIRSNIFKKNFYETNELLQLSVSSSPQTLSFGRGKKQGLYHQTEYFLETSLEEITQNTLKETYKSVTNAEVAGGMFESTWGVLLAAFSIPMEEMDSMDFIDTCLEGFECAIKVCCKFLYHTERKAFISALLAFTHLTNLREIEYKSVKSIVVLIRVAVEEGDNLGGSWFEVLRCISLLAKLQIVAESPSLLLPLSQNEKSGGVKASNVVAERDSQLSSQLQRERTKLEKQNAETIAKYIDEVEVHRLFSRSSYLKDTAVVDLVEALCLVSAEELGESPPRLFSLQKLIEVTDANIGRLRYIWSRMWTSVSRHFVTVGLGSDQLVSMVVVDHLRQLASKFLSRGELGSFSLQKEMFRPFEIIASKTRSSVLKGHIVDSLGQMVEAQGENLGSGWCPLLTALEHCVRHEESVDVISRATIVLQRITLCFTHLLNNSDWLILINAWAVIARSAFVGNFARSAVWYICYIAFISKLSAGANRHNVHSQEGCDLRGVLSTANGEAPTMAYLNADGEKNNKSKDILLLTEDIKDMISHIVSIKFHNAGAEESVGEGKFEPICSFIMGVFASLVRRRSVSGDAVDAMMVILSNQYVVSTLEVWWQAVGYAVIPALEFLFQQCRSCNETQRDVWSSLLKQAVGSVVNLTRSILNNSLFPVDCSLFLLKVIVGGSCAGELDAMVEIGLEGGRQMLSVFAKQSIVDEVLWDGVMTYIHEVGDIFMGALEFFGCRPLNLIGQRAVRPTLLVLLQYVKWLRDAALIEHLTTSCRTKAVKTILVLLQRVMCLLRSSVCFPLTNMHEKAAYDVALFILLERSLCNAILSVEERYGDSMEDERNTFWMLVMLQYIVVSRSGSDINRQEAGSLGELVGHLLDDLLQAPLKVMMLRCRVYMSALCQLIAVDQKAFTTSLACLFWKYHTTSSVALE